MAKVKQNKIADSGRKAESNKVKEGRVTKAPEPVKAKNIELASKKQAKEGKTEKSSKKSKKAPTPPPESSESESDASSASEGDSDASDESEAEVSSKPVTAVKAAVNGASKILNGVKAAATKSEETSSEGSEGSESESDSENETVTAKPNGVKASAVANDSASESDSESDEEDVAAAVNGKKDVSSDDESDEGSDSDEDSDDSSASSDVEMGDNKKSAAPNTATKRKADTVDEPAAKKAKTTELPNAVKNLFVGNLSWNIDEDWLRREFEEFGTVVGCRIVTDRDSGRSKGFGYVDFEDPASASKALEAKKGTDLDGRPLNVDFSEPRQDRAANANPRDRANARSQQFGDATNPPSDTLFIANLSFDATAEVLKENFEEYGTITRVSLPTHPDSGQMKGFGYIGFSSIEEAQAAFDAWKGESLLGRPIRVDFSTPRPDNGGFGGGRGGGGRGGGGFRGGRGGGFDRGGRGGGGRGGGRGRGAPRGGGRGGSTNRGGLGDFSGKKMTF